MRRTEEGLRDAQIKRLWDQQEDVSNVCVRHICDLQYSVDMEGALHAHYELQSAINVLLKLVLKEAMLREEDEDNDTE